MTAFGNIDTFTICFTCRPSIFIKRYSFAKANRDCRITNRLPLLADNAYCHLSQRRKTLNILLRYGNSCKYNQTQKIE